MSDSNARMTNDELQAIRDRLRNQASVTTSARIASADIAALLEEVTQHRLNEASWNKESERHERDHRDHYAERERLRADLGALQDAVRAAFGDLWWVVRTIKPMPLDEMLIRARHRLRHDHEEKCGVVVENLRQTRRELAEANSKLEVNRCLCTYTRHSSCRQRRDWCMVSDCLCDTCRSKSDAKEQHP